MDPEEEPELPELSVEPEADPAPEFELAELSEVLDPELPELPELSEEFDPELLALAFELFVLPEPELDDELGLELELADDVLGAGFELKY